MKSKNLIIGLLALAFTALGMNVQFIKSHVLSWTESDSRATGYYVFKQASGSTNVVALAYVDGFTNQSFDLISQPNDGDQFVILATNAVDGSVADSEVFTNANLGKPFNVRKR